MSDGVSDRRAHPRIDTSIDLHVDLGDGGELARMITCNLSLGGLYCTSHVDFPEMTRMAVRLALPERPGAAAADPIDIQAVVVRCRELSAGANGRGRYELALYFTRIDDEGRERLARYLDAVQ